MKSRDTTDFIYLIQKNYSWKGNSIDLLLFSADRVRRMPDQDYHNQLSVVASNTCFQGLEFDLIFIGFDAGKISQNTDHCK